MPSTLETVNRTAFTFRSDIPSSDRFDHKSGVLHTFKLPYTHGREEHAFAWLDDKTHENVDLVMSQLAEYGFDESKMLFVPFSSKENWLHRYPHACPYIECDEEGTIKGTPYFHNCINSGPNIATETASTNISTNISSPHDSTRPAKRQRRTKSNNARLVQSAKLDDDERSQLHVEIYNYISWLHSQLIDLETTEGGRRHVRRSGISVPGLQNLMTKLESTFRNVREFKMREDEMKRNKEGGAGDGDDGGDEDTVSDSEKENAAPPKSLPLLEVRLEGELQRVMEETRKKNTKVTPFSSESDKYDFEDMFERLVAFKKEMGDFDIHPTYKDDEGICLGDWVSRIRRRKRELRIQKKLECEPPDGNDLVSLPISKGRLGLCLQFYKSGIGAVITAIDPACTFQDQIDVGDRLVTIDGNVVSKVEDLSIGKEKKVRMFGVAKKMSYHGTYLSLERVERLESIGFKWVIHNTKEKKTWEERFEQLKQYKEKHGKWPIRKEKWEGIGEWIHEQRRCYVRKDKNFMENRAPKLEEIGFPFVLRKISQINWEDYVQKLAEFHRVNRHFDVPRPEDGSGDNGKEESEANEALRFHKWVHQELPMFYRAYKKGKQSRLTAERVKQLEDMGFVFKESESTRELAPVPDIAFSKRVEQLQKFYEEFRHLKIDHRFKGWDNFGGWAADISKRHKDWEDGIEVVSPLEEQQFHELSALGFEFNINTDDVRTRRSWDENFEALCSFAAENGHTQVPQKYKADVRLAVWVTMQRQEHKLLCEGKPSKLTQERYAKLEDAGFLWEVKRGRRR